MTVTNTTNFKEYQADGIATVFTIPFLLLDRADLLVYLEGVLLSTGFTVSSIGNPISEIIFNEAPKGRLLLQRSIALVRETDYQENGDLLAKTINQDFDRIYMILQDKDQNINQTIRVTDAGGVPPLTGDRAGKLLSFNEQGEPITIYAAIGSAEELQKNLANTDDPIKGAGLIGYMGNFQYPVKTVGLALRNAQTKIGSMDVIISGLSSNQQELTNRVSTLEKNANNFTILYPNGGTAANPATITINSRYVIDNPFKGYHVTCIAQVFYSNAWGETGWIYYNTGGNGVSVSHRISEFYGQDQIVIQTGNASLLERAAWAGNSLVGYVGQGENKTLPCRILVKRLN